MLGLSDRGAVRELFGHLLAGDGAGALAALGRQYDLGVDPQAVMRTLLEAVHGITLVKVGTPPDPAQPVEEREALSDWASRLSFPLLHRLWQLLLKGHEEVGRAALPIEACEMALLRVVHASQLPDPGELARQIREGGVQVAPAATAPPPAPAAAPTLPSTAEAIGDTIAQTGRMALAEAWRNHARPVRIEPPEIELSTARPIPSDFPRDLMDALKIATGVRWKVTTSDAPGTPSLREAERADDEAFEASIRETPVVAAALAAFPGAELVGPKTRRSMT